MEAPVGTVVMATTDIVGYGKWGELTYQQLWDEQPEYCLWTVNKFKELVKDGEELATKFVIGDSKMKRLAQWITETDEIRGAVEPEFECDSDMELIEVEKPETQTLAKRVAKLRAEKESQASKFYGVAFPEDHAGIYTSWAECKPHVVGVKGVMYKSFPTEEEAMEYVRNPPPRKIPEISAEVKAAREKARAIKQRAEKDRKTAAIRRVTAAEKLAKSRVVAAKREKAVKAKASKEKTAKTAKATAEKGTKYKEKGAKYKAAEANTKAEKKRLAAADRRAAAKEKIAKDRQTATEKKDKYLRARRAAAALAFASSASPRLCAAWSCTAARAACRSGSGS